MMNSAATVALGRPTSLGLHHESWSQQPNQSELRAAHLKRNCRFKLEISIVSMSITWMSLKPSRARLARISHPRPPAPVESEREVSKQSLCGDGGPERRTYDQDLARVAQEGLRLLPWAESFVGKGTSAAEDLVEVLVPGVEGRGQLLRLLPPLEEQRAVILPSLPVRYVGRRGELHSSERREGKNRPNVQLTRSDVRRRSLLFTSSSLSKSDTQVCVFRPAPPPPSRVQRASSCDTHPLPSLY